MPERHDDEVLARLKRASDALDAATKASKMTVQQVSRAKQTVEKAKKDAQLHDTSGSRKPKPRARTGKHR